MHIYTIEVQWKKKDLKEGKIKGFMFYVLRLKTTLRIGRFKQ